MLKPVNRSRAKQKLDELTRQAFIQQRQLWNAKTTGAQEAYVPSTRWDGGVHRGKKYKPIWPTIVDKCLHLQLNPIKTVLMYFENCTSRRDSLPMPNELLSHALLTTLVKQQPASAAAIMVQEESAKQRLAVYLHSVVYELGLNGKDGIAYALMNTQETWSPLLRYMIAVAEDIDQVADRFRDCALTQYLADPGAYDAVFAKSIPGEFIDVAQELSI